LSLAWQGHVRTKFSCPACGRQGFQKRIRQLADAEPANFDAAPYLRQLVKALDVSIMFFLF
jgi:hypothetical protein